MRDLILTCIQCSTPFVCTAVAQTRLQKHGFERPKRCPECRRKKAKTVKMDEELRHRKKHKHVWQKIRRGIRMG